MKRIGFANIGLVLGMAIFLAGCEEPFKSKPVHNSYEEYGRDALKKGRPARVAQSGDGTQFSADANLSTRQAPTSSTSYEAWQDASASADVENNGTPSANQELATDSYSRSTSDPSGAISGGVANLRRGSKPEANGSLSAVSPE